MNEFQAAYSWALSQEKIIQDAGYKLKTVEFINPEDFVDRLGCQMSLFHDEATNDTLLCVYFHAEGLGSWQRLSNYDDLRQRAPEIVQLWLRNGVYLHVQKTGGKGSEVVNFNYLRKD